MRPTTKLVLLPMIALLSVASQCEVENKPIDVWAQFHADGASRGYINVRTGFALQPKWSTAIGRISYSSPVIDGNGTIYVGTTHGEIAAVRPDGSIKYKKHFTTDPSQVSSPAVGPDARIYIISTTSVNERFTSTLYSINSDNGEVARTFHFPGNGFTTASPKVWGSARDLLVFVYSLNNPSSQLFVLNQNLDVVTSELVCGNRVTSSAFDWWKIFTLGLPFEFKVGSLSNDAPLGPLHPTVSVVDYKNYTLPNQPIIIVADNLCGIRVFQWGKPALFHLWDALNDDLLYSSPMVSNSGLVVVGRNDGHVLAYDAKNGTELWNFDAKEAVIATPASFVDPVFAASLTHFFVLSNNGQLINKLDLGGSTVASPALAADKVYLSTDAGLYSFTWDLNSFTRDGTTRGGFSSPAIGKDGTIYVVTADGQLRAYQGR